MNVLEKILEEIEEKFKTADAEKCDCEELCDVEDWYDSGYIDGQLSAHEKCMDIIRSHMDDITDDGWIPVEEGFPEDCEEMVLVQVSGKVTENIWFDNAFELATYVNGEGWILENYPEWKNPKVIAWQPLPEPYRPKEKNNE